MEQHDEMHDSASQQEFVHEWKGDSCSRSVLGGWGGGGADIQASCVQACYVSHSKVQ